MGAFSELDDKINLIRSAFSNIIGSKIERFETAEVFHDDGTWSDWPDLPIRLISANNMIVSIVWSRFDDLWIVQDLSLPFSIEGSTVRWVNNSIGSIQPIIDSTICAVHIGRGQFSIEDREIEIWTRLLIEVSTGWLEIFNALDENGYNFHVQMPEGKFIRCI